MEDEDLYTRITLRIPKDLHQKLSEQAKASSKSLNAEIIGSLEQTSTLQQQVGELRSQLLVLNQLLASAQQELIAKKQTDKDQWQSHLEESNSLWQEIKIYRMRYRELATLFNAYYAVIDSAIAAGKIDPEELGAGRQVVSLITDLLEQSEHRMVADAVLQFLSGAEHPVAAASVKEAIDLLSKAAWHLEQVQEKQDIAKSKRQRSKRKLRSC